MTVWQRNLGTRWRNFRHVRAMNRVIVKRHGERKFVIYTTGDDRMDDLRIALWCAENEVGQPQMADVSLHERRRADRTQDPGYRAAYERERAANEAPGADHE